MDWKKVAERLKTLREEKGLSHEKLKKELEEKYKDMSISVASLKKYEVSEDEHRYAKSVCGMKTEYLYYFADFYGVSTDYVLGLSDVKTKNETIQSINEKTGLSTKAIIALKIEKDIFENDIAEFISHLICCDDLSRMISLIRIHNQIDPSEKTWVNLIKDDKEMYVTELLKHLISDMYWKMIEQYTPEKEG